MRTIAVCAAGIVLMALAVGHLVSNDDDFRQFYRAATLARAHQDVYTRPSFSPDTNTEGAFLPYNRIPSYAIALAPLASLPYSTARRVWISTGILAFAACLWLFPHIRDRLALAMAFSFPVALTFALAQDIACILLITLAAARIYAADRKFLAGLTASLLAIKFTCLPAVGLVFLAKTRRGTIGLAIGILAQIALSFVIAGPNWPSEYLALLRKSSHAFEVRRMPNIHSISASLGLPDAVWIVAAILTLAWLFTISRRLRFSDALLVALPLGLIASPYGFAYDTVVLLPLLVSVVSMDSLDGMLAGAALTPVPCLLLMTDGTIPLLAGSVLIVASTVAGVSRFAKLRVTEPMPLPASHADLVYNTLL
jgi:hypothetical protein